MLPTVWVVPVVAVLAVAVVWLAAAARTGVLLFSELVMRPIVASSRVCRVWLQEDNGPENLKSKLSGDEQLPQ
ncbi:hypothetical protein [Mangrovibrevibacter kandeliae]|uniref:hypothetical protein n=1 Tax=Mangrovibrevibacter kandeliae TaxID=2968473 RepID=UPI0021181D9A|nr:hypothetical protein [Aurantimonas sp. CSK15Z-1]MCQ8781514.1 hypothetical protein [Aurantimonas sp. CSK15Z-1]